MFQYHFVSYSIILCFVDTGRANIMDSTQKPIEEIATSCPFQQVIVHCKSFIISIFTIIVLVAGKGREYSR